MYAALPALFDSAKNEHWKPVTIDAAEPQFPKIVHFPAPSCNNLLIIYSHHHNHTRIRITWLGEEGGPGVRSKKCAYEIIQAVYFALWLPGAVRTTADTRRTEKRDGGVLHQPNKALFEGLLTEGIAEVNAMFPAVSHSRDPSKTSSGGLGWLYWGKGLTDWLPFTEASL